MKALIDLTGQQFGRLTVIRRVPHAPYTDTKWLCRCECGTEKVIATRHLRLSKVISCGCAQRESATKHGMDRTPTYYAWAAMKQRCENPRNRFYKDYGARGIGYCPRWAVFENFLADMGERPDGLWLERIDNAKGYSPENCRWATPKEQRRNTRANRYVTWQNETRCVTEWAEVTGLSPMTIRSRLKAGWEPERIFTTPPDARKATKRKLFRS